MGLSREKFEDFKTIRRRDATLEERKVKMARASVASFQQNIMAKGQPATLRKSGIGFS